MSIRFLKLKPADYLESGWDFLVKHFISACRLYNIILYFHTQFKVNYLNIFLGSDVQLW